MEKEQRQSQIGIITDFRLKIDGLMSLMEQNELKLDGFPESYDAGHPYRRAHVSLGMGKAWLGKCLEHLKTESPYKKDGTRKSVKDIEPKADSNMIIDAIIKEFPDTDYPLMPAFIHYPTEDFKKNGFSYYSELNSVQQIDWIREQTKKVTMSFLQMPPLGGALAKTCVQNVYTHLTEARFNLGFQLQEIRDVSE